MDIRTCTGTFQQESPMNAPYLPVDTKKLILAFLDPSTLSRCAIASKELKKVATSDAVWRSHLQLLLEVLYDSCRMRQREGDQVIPPSLRPLKSTEMMQWLQEHRMRIDRLEQPVSYLLEMPITDGIVEHPWLCTDVSFYEYYQKAANWAIMAEFKHYTYEMETGGKCAACIGGCWHEECSCGYYVRERFRDTLHTRWLFQLPQIRLLAS